MTAVELSKAKEDALMQQLLASVFMSVGAAVAIIAVNGRFIAANPAFSRLLRYAGRILEGRSFWDLIAPQDSSTAAAGSAHCRENEAPYEFDARMRLGDGGTGLMHVNLTSIGQPQFKRFRLVALRQAAAEPAEPAGSAAPAKVVVAGNIQLVGLDQVKAALGARWAAHAERTMHAAEAIIRNRLGPQDVFSRTPDQGFVICFAEGNEQQAAFRAAAIAREIRNRLIGEADDQAGSSVTAVTLSVDVDPDQMEEGRPILTALQRRLDSARAEAERRARAAIAVSMEAAVIEPEPVFNNLGKSVPILFTRLPQALQEEMDVALAVLSTTDSQDADLDVLKLTLAARAILADVASGRSFVYLLPVNFALFAHRKRLERYLEICRNFGDAVRPRLMFMLSEVPRTASQSRLFEAVRLLKPFGKGVGLELDSAEFTQTDLAQYRIPLVALSAEELLGTARSSPTKLDRFVRQLRLNGARLLARDVHGEVERQAVAGIGADLVTFGAAETVADGALAPTGEIDVESAAFAAAVKHAKIAVVITDSRLPDNPISSCNPAFTEMTGYTAEEAIGRHWSFLHGRGTSRQVYEEILEAVKTGTPIRRELLLYRKDGTPIMADLVISPVHDHAGKLISVVGMVTDITALRRAESGRRAIAKLYDDLVENIPGYIFQRTVTAEGQVEFGYLSPSFKRLIGVPLGEPLSKPYLDWIHPDDLPTFNRALQKSWAQLAPLAIEVRLIAQDGRIIWVRALSRPARRDDGAVVWNGIALDISSEKAVEGTASYLAGHDALTGLVNRQTFKNRLCEVLTEIEIGESGAALGVLSIDLSNFRTINDAFGATIGDAVLKAIGDRIQRFGGVRIAGRMGGDLFTAALALESAGAVAEARALGQAIAQPIEVDGRRVMVLAALGLALYPDHAPGADVHQAADILIKAADIALFAAKRAGPGTCLLYEPEHDDRIRNRAMLQHSLHAALAQKQFMLHYQPVVDLGSGRILGAEALVRWNHPELGLQRPDQFIPLAEKSGLIIPLGAWVLDEVLRDLRAWDIRGIGRPRIAINVATAQLQHPDWLTEIRRQIADSGFNPGQIEIELTESAFIDPTPKMLANLAALRALGVTVAIDDFGTGYSSFRYLRSLPIDKLKIDQSFIRHMVPESGDEALVRGMISIGRDLGLTVVVEGVETAEQRDILLRQGCSVGQGYFYSMPLNPEDFAWMYGQNIRLPMPKAADALDDTQDLLEAAADD